MNAKIKISHEHIQQALSKFYSQGGLIRKLPATPDVRVAIVHERSGTLAGLVEEGRPLRAWRGE